MTLSVIHAASKTYFLCTFRKALWDGKHIFTSVNGNCWHHQLRKWCSWSFIGNRDVIQRVTSYEHRNYVAAYWRYMRFTTHSYKIPHTNSQLPNSLTVARIASPHNTVRLVHETYWLSIIYRHSPGVMFDITSLSRHYYVNLLWLFQ
jgi:hypothetical protein